jgi:quercetin dioxygenase-like cupin family protein
VPIEVRRFGVGHRRPDGPPGTVGIEGQVIQSGSTGIISELAFGRRARIIPHTNPNTTWFIVIEGGGWVGVGDERTRVTAGEAVVWPPDVLHGAWTEGSPMRAIVVELPEPPLQLAGVVDGLAGEIAAASDAAPRPAPGPGASAGPEASADRGQGSRPVARGEGRLRPRPADSSRRGEDPKAEQGEPL